MSNNSDIIECNKDESIDLESTNELILLNNENKSQPKTFSVSSTDSFLSNSDIAAIDDQLEHKLSHLERAEAKAAPGSSSLLLKKLDEDDENFDFAKTGAKPKRKQANLNSKSSLSSSTSSSLSSLSIHSSALTYASSTATNNTNNALLSANSLAPSSSASITNTSSSNSSTCSANYKPSTKTKPFSFDSVGLKKSLNVLRNESSFSSFEMPEKKSGSNYYGELSSHHNQNNDDDYDADILKLNEKSLNKFVQSKDSELLLFDTKKNLLVGDDNDFLNRTDDSSDEIVLTSIKDADMEPKKKPDLQNCPLCFKLITTDLDQHFQLAHKEFECFYCNLLFDTDYSLNRHISTVHGGDDANEFGDDPPLLPTTQHQTHLIDSTSDWKSEKNENLAMKETAERFVCPICNLEAQSQVWLEIHVDSHFNSNSDDNNVIMNENFGASAFPGQSSSNRSRSQSDSSLAGNVDENFEIDQLITLTDCDVNNSESSSREHFRRGSNEFRNGELCSIRSNAMQ